MIVVGVIGGIASGKSSVAEALQQLGAGLIQADQLGHEVLREPEIKELLRARWGDVVFAADGEIDRKKVAGLVFGAGEKSPELQFLESVTHPRIDARIREKIREFGRQRVPVVVLDAPVLLEGGWGKHCDRILFVDVDRPQRLARALARGWTEPQFAAREAAQLSVDEKRKVADEVIDNSASFDHTLAQIQHFWRSLIIPPE